MVIASLGPVILFELVAQTASLYANNGINSGIKRLAPVEHLESDGVFLEPMGLPKQALFDDELQETADSMGLYKDAAT